MYKKTGRGLNVTRDMKILDKLAQEIFSLKAHPDKHQRLFSIFIGLAERKTHVLPSTEFYFNFLVSVGHQSR